MTFIYDQDRAQAAAVTRIENLAQFDQEIGFVFPLADVEERGQVLIELRRRQTWIEDVRHHHGAIEALHHPAQQRRLAGADFASYHD